MDLKAYIESGILERYAIGDATDAEMREVEKLAAQYPEVQTELEAISASLETYASIHSVAPPSHLKNKIWSRINHDDAVTDSKIVKREIISEKTKVISIGRYNTLLAAASVALLISLGVNYYLYNRWNETSSRLASLQSEQTELAKQFDAKRASLEQTQQQLALITKPSVKPVTLKGTPTNADALATIYWDKETNDVYLLANHMHPTPADKQYQLWAIVDGKPVDAGVFTVSSDSASLQKMKSIADAQAFAVTIERLGGSPTPSLETMVVIGSI